MDDPVDPMELVLDAPVKPIHCRASRALILGVVHKILWSPATGAHAIVETGAIGNAWKRAGYQRGWGYPTASEYRVGTEVRQRFSNGYVAPRSALRALAEARESVRAGDVAYGSEAVRALVKGHRAS